MQKNTVSRRTLNNWLIDAAVFVGALIAAISGIYFLFLPIGGYQGGRNPAYGITVLFSRHTWEYLHTWFGIVMIAAVVVHLAIHWNWVTGTTRRLAKSLVGQGARMNRYGIFNVAVDAAVALGFLLVALSGIYFLFAPGGGRTADPMFIFSRTAWDMIHTWSGVVMIIAAVIHFAIHWRWVTKVTAKVMASIKPRVQPMGEPARVRVEA